MAQAACPPATFSPARRPCVSTNNDACLTQDIAGANKLLDDGGYVDSNGDGIRETRMACR